MVASKDMPPRTEGFGSTFFKNQFRTTIPIPTRKEADVTGKVAIVTGANSGLGLESSKQLLALGLSRLTIAVRSPSRGEAAASKLRLAYPKAAIDVWALDMESYQSVQDFVRRCDSHLSQIDIVILNAGGMAFKFRKAPNGHEQAVQVNYLSTVLLVLLLVPILKAKSSASATPPHITVVSSIMGHLAKWTKRNAKPLLPSFDDEKIPYSEYQERYGVSKQLGQLFLVKLTDYVKADDVIINMVDPGLTKGTRLAASLPIYLKPLYAVFLGVAARPVNRGAATYIDAAVIQGKESHGCFLLNCGIAP